MDEPDLLDAALGHLEAASNWLLSATDPDSSRLLAALACLEAQHDLADLGAVAQPTSFEVDQSRPANVAAARAALSEAVRHLGQVVGAAALAAKLEAIVDSVT